MKMMPTGMDVEGRKTSRPRFCVLSLLLLCSAASLMPAHAGDLTVDTATVSRVFTVLGPPPPIATNSVILSGTFTNGLLGYWPLNETNGTTALDKSGNGYNGTYSATVVPDTSSPRGYGAHFGYSEMSARLSSWTGGSAPYSMAAWIIDSSWGTLEIDASGSACVDKEITLFLTSWSGVQFGNYYHQASYTYDVSSAWHHYVVTSDGSTVTSYVDGDAQGTTSAYSAPTNNLLTVHASWTWNSGSASFADVAFWNRALSSAEVSSIYNGTPVNTNILIQASGTNILLKGDTLIQSLVRQGDIEMGTFTNRP